MLRDNTLLTLPNMVSGLRAPAALVVVWLIMTAEARPLAAALVVMVVAELSGVAARAVAHRRAQATLLRESVDAAFDGIYHLSVFVAFLAIGWLPAWMLFVIYFPGLAVPYIRTFVRQSGHDLPVRAGEKGKIAVYAVAQIGIVAMALGLVGDGAIDGVWPQVLLFAAMAASLFSLADHGVAASRLLEDRS